MTGNSNSLVSELVLGEVAAKNSAIAAYDGIIWKVRTGYLTLLFATWAILLKAVMENTRGSQREPEALVASVFLFSLGLATSAWHVDHTYVRRKARVILALNRLMAAIDQAAGDSGGVPVDMLQVAGDNPDLPCTSKGYNEATRDAYWVFFAPLVSVAAGALCVLFGLNS